MNTSDPNTAVVTLAADTKPWEQGLDKAAQASKGWASRITSLFSGVQNATASGGVLGGLLGGGKGVAGGALGGALGAVGGPIGSLLGATIGGSLVPSILGAVDFDRLGDRLRRSFPDLTKSIRDTFKGVEDFVEGLLFSVGMRFGEIADFVSKVDFGEMLSGDLDETGDRISAFADYIGTKLVDMAAGASARISDGIDAIWNRVKGFLAGGLDLFQGLLRRIGLVSEGTNKWGDSLRNVNSIVTTVAKGIAYFGGYTRDIFVQIGGYITKYFTVPLLEGVRRAMTAIGKLAEAGKMLPAVAGGGEGGVYDQVGKALGGRAKELEGIIAKWEKQAEDGINLKVGTTGEAWAKQVETWLGRFLARGRELNKADDKIRKGEDLRPVDTMIKGSREAAAAILKSRTETKNSGRIEPIEQVARLAREQLEVARQARDALLDLVRRGDTPPVVEIEAV